MRMDNTTIDDTFWKQEMIDTHSDLGNVEAIL